MLVRGECVRTHRIRSFILWCALVPASTKVPHSRVEHIAEVGICSLATAILFTYMYLSRIFNILVFINFFLLN